MLNIEQLCKHTKNETSEDLKHAIQSDIGLFLNRKKLLANMLNFNLKVLYYPLNLN